MQGFFLVLLAMVTCAGSSFGAIIARSYTVTPVITADAYAQGDQIGTYTALTGIFSSSGRTLDLKNLFVIDQAKVKADLDILFFNALPVLASADNAAVSFTDAVAAANFVGRVSVAAADYVDTASNSVAQKAPTLLLTGKGSSVLYVVLVCKAAGGCDYAAVDDLVLRLNFLE